MAVWEGTLLKHSDRDQRKRKNFYNAVMLCCAALFLFSGLARTLLRPKNINYYENRPANTVAPLTVSGWLDGSFQSAMEAALNDQIPMAQRMKRYYNSAENAIKYRTMLDLSRKYPSTAISYGSLYVYGGKYLAYWPYQPDRMPAIQEALDARCDNINQIIAAHPDVSFYLYQINTDLDMDFTSGRKSNIFSYIHDRIQLPDDRMGQFVIDDLDAFEHDFYCTDHHWNYQGSYRGYQEVAALLGCSGPLLAPEETVKVCDHFSGSKSNSIGAQDQFYEAMYAYRFSFPNMSITISGEPADDYGQQEAALSGLLSNSASYGNVYGSDNGEIIFDTGTTGRGNLLVLGESYDNAILKLLASHFDRLYSVDLRSYEQDMGKPFHMAEYLREHRIDRVLLIGSSPFYIADDFALED